jgi:hypothetical protein
MLQKNKINDQNVLLPKLNNLSGYYYKQKITF